MKAAVICPIYKLGVDSSAVLYDSKSILDVQIDTLYKLNYKVIYIVSSYKSAIDSEKVSSSIKHKDLRLVFIDNTTDEFEDLSNSPMYLERGIARAMNRLNGNVTQVVIIPSNVFIDSSCIAALDSCRGDLVVLSVANSNIKGYLGNQVNSLELKELDVLENASTVFRIKGDKLDLIRMWYSELDATSNDRDGLYTIGKLSELSGFHLASLDNGENKSLLKYFYSLKDIVLWRGENHSDRKEEIVRGES